MESGELAMQQREWLTCDQHIMMVDMFFFPILFSNYTVAGSESLCIMVALIIHLRMAGSSNDCTNT